jgi:GH15 family glucan-1,4-alpha-glucosidase
VDLYTSSRRIARTFQLDGRPIAHHEHALVGDGSSCALIGVDGSISWLCLPRFDSPSVFASILDPEIGGRCQLAPTTAGCESRQAYDDDTNVLQTLFHREGSGTAVLTDFMPWTEDRPRSLHELHRMIEVREGALDFSLVFDPRFDYARGETTIEVTEHGALATSPDGERLAISISPVARFETRSAGGVEARFTLRAGRRAWAVLAYGTRQVEPTARYRPFEQLRRTRRFWRSWSARLRYDGPWRHDVLRSALTLKLLQYVPTGAMVAAPTTSLPVSPDGLRNWDYRFSWTRDSAMAVRAMNLIGYGPEALEFFRFVCDGVDRRSGLDLMLGIEGGDVPSEVTLPHLAGHNGSGHVRIGNAASLQIQHDITGPLLDATYIFERSGGLVTLRLWREIRSLVSRAADLRSEPDHGIWEPRDEPRHHVHSKLMTWVALDRAIRMAPHFGGDADLAHWIRCRDELAAEILQRGVDPTRPSFVESYDGKDVDASLLAVSLYGFLQPDDPRVIGTVDRIQSELAEGPFVRRYRAADGIGTDEGCFVLCGFWLAEALALAGRLDEGLEVMRNHVGAANHVGLLAEEIDAASRAPLGNFPQAFSHLGLIQAAARLDLALRLRDEGGEQPPRHALELSD